MGESVDNCILDELSGFFDELFIYISISDSTKCRFIETLFIQYVALHVNSE